MVDIKGKDNEKESLISLLMAIWTFISLNWRELVKPYAFAVNGIAST